MQKLMRDCFAKGWIALTLPTSPWFCQWIHVNWTLWQERELCPLDVRTAHGGGNFPCCSVLLQSPTCSRTAGCKGPTPCSLLVLHAILEAAWECNSSSRPDCLWHHYMGHKPHKAQLPIGQWILSVEQSRCCSTDEMVHSSFVFCFSVTLCTLPM